MIGVALGTAALVVVLSVFNGLEGLIRSLYSSFDPEIKIESSEGKWFTHTDSLINEVSAVSGVAVVSEIIEDNALIRYKDSEMVVRLKGVSENFQDQKRLDKVLVDGTADLRRGDVQYAILGLGVVHNLSITSNDEFTSLQIYYPKNTKGRSSNPRNLYNQKAIMPGGIFAIEKQYDEQFVFVPLSFAEELFQYDGRRTSLEIKVADGQEMERVQARLKEALGAKFLVTNKDEQHPSLFRAIKIEKLFALLAFFFILGLASLSTFFTLNMLALDKQKDISVLLAMGAPRSLVKYIFIQEGAIISLVGAVIGLVVGYLICLVQINFGLVSMGMETSVVSAYPVKMQAMDFVYTAVCVIIITFLASYRPAAIAAKTAVLPNL